MPALSGTACGRANERSERLGAGEVEVDEPSGFCGDVEALRGRRIFSVTGTVVDFVLCCVLLAAMLL